MTGLSATFFAAMALFALATVLGLAAGSTTHGNRASRAQASLCALASAALVAFGGLLVLGGESLQLQAGQVLSFVPLDLRFDALGGVFVVALGVVGVAASLEALDSAPTTPANALTGAAYPLFLVSLLLVFGAANGFAFLLAWELMALASGALVVGARPSPEQVRAAYVYLAATHVATGALLVAFAVLSAGAGGSLAFADWGDTAPGLDPLARDAVFLLLVAGFATKAGVIPFHIWLPRAHPAAPAHVSALMSGVMIKSGIYGLIRLGADVLGNGPEWWGLLLLGLGAVSTVLGVLYALMEHDLKRLLAFHSIENIGIIVLGLGAAFTLRAADQPAAAAAALVAALLHSVNHAAFKGLLFVASGAIQHAAGTRDLNRLGGLARVMPLTAVAFGVGAASLGGLPPLNGFASEWQTFHGLIGTVAAPIGPVARILAAVAIGALALAAALGLAAAVKMTGVSFLALPRSDGAARAHEPGRPTLVALGLLAIVCIGGGLAAGWTAGVLGGVAAGVLGAPPAPLSGQLLPVPLGSTTTGAFDPLGVGVLLLAGIGLVGLAAGLALRRRRDRIVGPTWTCGIAPEPAFEYTATSYAKPVRLFFRQILQPVRTVRIDHHAGTPLPRSIHYHGEVSHVIERDLYRRAHALGIATAQVVRRVQNGSLQLYLGYVLVAVVVLLLVTR